MEKRERPDEYETDLSLTELADPTNQESLKISVKYSARAFWDQLSKESQEDILSNFEEAENYFTTLFLAETYTEDLIPLSYQLLDLIEESLKKEPPRIVRNRLQDLRRALEVFLDIVPNEHKQKYRNYRPQKYYDSFKDSKLSEETLTPEAAYEAAFKTELAKLQQKYSGVSDAMEKARRDVETFIYTQRLPDRKSDFQDREQIVYDSVESLLNELEKKKRVQTLTKESEKPPSFQESREEVREKTSGYAASTAILQNERDRAILSFQRRKRSGK